MADVQAAEPADETLVLAVKNGSPEAFEQIVRRYRDNVYGYLKTCLKDASRAEDASQEVFLRLFRSAGTYRPVEGGRFRYWLFTIVANVARSAHRSRPRSVPLDPNLDIATPIRDSSDQAERIERVRDAIEKLPDEQKEVVLLKEYEGLTFDEVARALSIPVNTAKSRMRYGLLKLSELLQGYLR